MKILCSLASLCASCLIPGTLSAQMVFSGSGTGAIPDGGLNGPADWGSPLNVTFNVSGLANNISSISLSITMNHSFVGDVDAVLIPPVSSGGSPFTIFSRVAQSPSTAPGTPTFTFGSTGTFGSDTFGTTPATYVFNDGASGNLWSTAGFDTSTGTANFDNVFNLPAGSYRTSVSGPWDEAGNPNGGDHNAGQFTSFATDSGFAGLTPAQAAGTWTLRMRDGGSGDVGSVTDASLSITVVPEPSQYALMAGLALIAFAGYRRYARAKG